MIYYDQSHDISEPEPRNKLFKNVNKKSTTSHEESADSNQRSEIFLSQGDIYTKSIILQYLYEIMLDDVKQFILIDKPGIFNGGREARDGSEILIKNFRDYKDDKYYTLAEFLQKIVNLSNQSEDKRQTASEELIKFYFNIEADNIGTTLKEDDIPFDCNHNYRTLLSVVNYTKTTLIKDIYPEIEESKFDNTKNKIIATVDADKSKFNVSSIASVICALNVVNMSHDDDRLTFLSDPASEFDSAGTSSVETLVTRLLGKKSSFPTLSNFKVMLGERCIIDFQYEDDDDFIIPIYMNLVSLQKIKNIWNLINGKNRFELSEQEKIYAKEQLTEAGITDNNFKAPQKQQYIQKYDKFFKNLQEDREKVLPNSSPPSTVADLIKKLSIPTDVKRLIVKRFFNLAPKVGDPPFTRNGKNSSVNQITTDIVKNLTNHGNGDFKFYSGEKSIFYKLDDTGTYAEFNKADWLREFNKYIIFKELGDLGQILSTYCLQLHKRHAPNESRIDQTIYFITFDKLAGKMSSLFNYGTIFEPNEHSLEYNARFPLLVFVYKGLADWKDILDPVKILLSLQEDDKDNKDDKDDKDDEDDVKDPHNFILKGLSEEIDGEQRTDDEQLPDLVEKLGKEESEELDSEDAEKIDPMDAEPPPPAPPPPAPPPPLADSIIGLTRLADAQPAGQQRDSKRPRNMGGKKNKKKTKKKKNKKN